MPRPASILLPGLAGLLLLAGCSAGGKPSADAIPEDPAIVDALADPIMTDPDLVSQNLAHAAIVASGPVNSALPPIDRSDGAIAAAKDEAEQLVGDDIRPAPEPSRADVSTLRDAVTAAQMAAAARVTNGDCARNVEYTAKWAALLPGPLQVYPRGAVEEAAGNDAIGCALRVVHFRTPVAVDDVIAFYHARLRAASYPVQHGADGVEHVLRGRKGAAAYLVYVRPAEDGLTAADVVVRGV